MPSKRAAMLVDDLVDERLLVPVGLISRGFSGVAPAGGLDVEKLRRIFGGGSALERALHQHHGFEGKLRRKAGTDLLRCPAAARS